MNQPQVTIRQIAEKAGVSHSTVSRALNNSPSISHETRDRIREIAMSMGYQTNPLVAAWMSHVRRVKTPQWTQGTLAYLETIDKVKFATSSRRSFYTRCQKGAAERARELGYHLKVVSADDFAGNLEGLDRMIRYGAFDGVVFPQTDQVRLEYNIDWDHVAGSTIGFRLDYPPFHRASVDAFANITLAMNILMKRGYKRIGLALTPSLDNLVNHTWVGSYLAFQHRHFSTSEIIPPLLVDNNSLDAVKSWYQHYRPDAILQCQKRIREMILQLGKKNPDELGLVDLNATERDTDMAGIDQDLELVGAVAVEQVIAQLHRNERGIPPKRQTFLISGYWKEGPSIR